MSRGINTQEYWDKEFIKTGKDNLFNLHYFQMAQGIGGRILDIAAGVSKNLAVLVMMYKGEFHTLDISKVSVEFWKKFGVKSKLFDVRKNNPLPYPDNYFDYVLSKSFLEHISKDDNFYLSREIRRVLKPTGYFIVMCASDFFRGGPKPREHIYPTKEGGVPVKDFLEMYKEFRLIKYDFIRGEHYAIFRWG